MTFVQFGLVLLWKLFTLGTSLFVFINLVRPNSRSARSALFFFSGSLVVAFFVSGRVPADELFSFPKQPLKFVRFETDELPLGYALADFDVGLGERLTGNPGYRLDSLNEEGRPPAIEGMYRNGLHTLSLLAFAAPDANQAKAFLDALIQSEPGTREVPIAILSKGNFAVMIGFWSAVDLPVTEVVRTQIAAEKMSKRLQMDCRLLANGQTMR